MTKVVVRNGNVDGALRTFKQKNALTEKFIPVGHLHLSRKIHNSKNIFHFFLQSSESGQRGLHS